MSIRNLVRQNSLFIGVAATFLLMQATQWPPLRYWGWWGGGNFLDSWQVLKSADCYNSIGLKIYHLDNPCMVYAYGRPLIWVLKIFHFGASQSSAFGIFFLLLLAYVLSTLIRKLQLNHVNQILLTAAIVFSPPILLLGDRGNFDSLCLTGLFLALWLFKRGNTKSAIVIIFILSTFKYYMLPLLILMPFLTKSSINRITSLGLFVIASFSIWRDLSITEFNFSSKTPHLTFGLGHEFLYFTKFNKFHWMQNSFQYLGLFLTCLLTTVSFLVLRSKHFSLREDNHYSKKILLFLLSTLILDVCYFSGFNADYRLIFLVVSALSLIQLNLHKILNNYVYVFLITILWLTFPSGDLEIIGDFALSIYVGVTLAIGLILTAKVSPSTLLDKPLQKNADSSN